MVGSKGCYSLGWVMECVLGGIQTEKTQDVWEYLVEIFQVVFLKAAE